MKVDKIKQIKENIDIYKNENKTTNFSDFISGFYKDKLIEICLNLEYERVTTEQSSSPIYTTIYGKVIGSVNNFLILDCYANKGHKIENGNVVFINQNEIISLQPYSNKCNLSDILIKYGNKVIKSLKDES